MGELHTGLCLVPSTLAITPAPEDLKRKKNLFCRGDGTISDMSFERREAVRVSKLVVAVDVEVGGAIRWA